MRIKIIINSLIRLFNTAISFRSILIDFKPITAKGRNRQTERKAHHSRTAFTHKAGLDMGRNIKRGKADLTLRTGGHLQ